MTRLGASSRGGPCSGPGVGSSTRFSSSTVPPFSGRRYASLSDTDNIASRLVEPDRRCRVIRGSPRSSRSFPPSWRATRREVGERRTRRLPFHVRSRLRIHRHCPTRVAAHGRGLSGPSTRRLSSGSSSTDPSQLRAHRQRRSRIKSIRRDPAVPKVPRVGDGPAPPDHVSTATRRCVSIRVSPRFSRG